MGAQNVSFFALNRGEVSVLALDRTDIERLRLAAETQVNWLPRTLGPMTLRPGTSYLGSVSNDFPSKMIPFIYAAGDTAAIEITSGLMRVWTGDVVVTRVGVATTVTDFSAGWTAVASAASSVTFPGGALKISGVLQGLRSSVSAALAVALADRTTEHALRITVTAGPITFRIGTAIGLDDVSSTTSLAEGVHSIAFIPGTGVATIYPQFESSAFAERAVNALTMEAAGAMTRQPTRWPTISGPTAASSHATPAEPRRPRRPT